MNEYITSSVTPIDPSQLFEDGFEFSTQNIIPSSDFTGSFIQNENLVEFYIYDASVNHLYSNYAFEGWSISNQNTDTQDPGATDTIVLNPNKDILDAGYQNGTLYAIYNFINLELNSSAENRYFISQISSDRTEIALQSNFIENSETAAAFSSLKERIEDADFFDEFYLSFGDNEYVIGVNLEIEETEDTLNILVKLFEPLPGEYQLQDEVYIVTKVGETQAYKVDFIEDFSSLLDKANYIKGPNINIELQDLVNNSTNLKSKSDLLGTDSSQSLDKLTEVLNQKGVVITPNYSYNTFNEFVNFSSAKSRINNFVEKVASIQAYQADIDTLIATTASNPNVGEISSSIASLETNIQNIIKNFDGFESYQYYTSESNAGGFTYPKTGSAYPYTLLSTTDTAVLEWLGSDVESNQYYGGYRLSASLYDEDNQNWLYYTIPDFIKENSDNDQYIEFSNMVGQHFDEIWLYTKTLSERFNTTNDPDSGLPLGLAEEAVKGLGFPAFGNNYNNQDNFIGLTGEDNGSYVPPTGSELINQYIAVNNGTVINYWNLEYSYLNYVEQLDDPGFPYAIDKVSKEIFKRLYHNMAYLTKKKGTISGLRQLINIWGIPNTILRINEFGGKNKDNSDDYDLWYNRYSLAYHPVSTQNVASSSVKIPWMPLQRNYIAESEYIVPDGFAFRFKTTGIPSSSYAGDFYSQSLAAKKSNGAEDNKMDFGVMLYYTPKTSGSYSGSASPDDQYYGELQFQLLGNTSEGGVTGSAAISLPFFNKGWWSVLVQRDQHVSASDDSNNTTYTIYAKNKQYNGYDGNSIGWEGSASFTIDGSTSSSYNGNWNSFGVDKEDGIYLGGYISGSSVRSSVFPPQPFGKIFSGSLQEFRYYSHALTESVFNDFVMNPESIEGNNITGSQSSFDIVNFRAPLGNELEHIFTSSVSESFVERIDSSHPAITGSASSVITGSFIDPDNNSVTSSYLFLGYDNITTRTYSKPNREVYFLDQPAIGIRNRVSNKVQIEDGDAYGTILSREVSIDQNYQISRSYTEDITSLEVAFSPQDEVNDDIIATFGYGVISDALADPRHLSSSDSYYPKLRSTAEEYFKKYTAGNIYDYLRLIKYFDNSLFKAIKSYVPARTSVTTGVVIKQHMLERNRRPPVNLDPTTKIAVNSSSSFNENIEFGNLEITSSIPVGTFSGGPGGVVDNFNISQMVTASLVSLTSSAVINTNGTHNPFEGGTYTVTDNVDGLFTFEGNAGIGYNQTRLSEEYPTFFEEEVPLIFIVSMVGGSQGFDGTFRLKKDGNTLEEIDFTSLGSNFNFTEIRFSPVFEKSGSLFTFEFDYDGGSVAWQSFKLGVFASYVNSDGNSAFKGPGIYNALTSPVGNRVPSAKYEYKTNRFNLRQGYINNVPTISGSQEIAEIHEREFYDGEYSGSEFIATSQSLFNNPYTSQTLLNTQYYVDVTESNANFSNKRLDNFTCRFSQSVFNNFDDAWLATRNFIATPQAEGFIGWVTVQSNIRYIAGLSLPWSSVGGGSEIYQYYQNFTKENAQPDEAWPYSYPQEKNSPYFQFEIPALGSTVFDNDTNFDNIKSSIIVGTALNRNTVAAYPPIITDDSNLRILFRDSDSNGNQVRRVTGTDLSDTISDTLKPVVTLYLKDDIATAQSASNTISTSPTIPSQGTASLTTTPVLFHGNDNSRGETKPLVLAFNNEVDDNGTVIDNTNTLINSPSYDVTLNSSGSTTPLNPDSYGLAGNVLDSSKLEISAIGDNPSANSTYYILDYLNNRSFSGSEDFNVDDTTVLFNFNPLLPSDFNFDNSDFNPIFNNVTESRRNSKIEIIDETQGINTPANLEDIKLGTAKKASTPDSNYTQQSRIIPRYVGSELKSLTYNTYTPSGSFTASNGDAIDWNGDISYGNTSAVNKNPIYFAHFKKSYHNLVLPNTFTFEIDSLIVSPQEDITGEEPIPTTLKVEGSNDLLFPVKSTFEVDRQAIVAYDSTNFTAPDGQQFDFSKLKVGSSLIFQGALEMNPIIGNFTETYGVTSEFLNPAFQPTMSFLSASWITNFTYSSANTGNPYVTIGTTYFADGPNILRCTQSNSTYETLGFLVTSSEGFYLGGGFVNIEVPTNPQGIAGQGVSTDFYGPGLGLINSINTQLSNSVIFDQAASGYIMGLPSYSGDVPAKTVVDNTLDQSYFRFNYTGSNLPGFIDSNEPFILKKGDEIVVTWNAGKGSGPKANYFTQVFQITGITGDQSVSSRILDYEAVNDAYFTKKIKAESLHNHIHTHPKPSEVPEMSTVINGFTIRRRVNADDRVIIYQTPPSGAVSVNQATEGGYLIPSDFTEQQKRNALTLINQLKEKNAFTRDNSGRSTT